MTAVPPLSQPPHGKLPYGVKKNARRLTRAHGTAYAGREANAFRPFSLRLREVFHTSPASAFHQTAALCARAERYLFPSQPFDSIIIPETGGLSRAAVQKRKR